MRYRFADYEVDAGRFVLLRNGQPAPIEPKPLQLLLHLLESHPKTVTKDELLDAVWGDTAVTEGSLTRAVREVRRALREQAGVDGVIRTVRGRGYGIGVDVQRVEESASPVAARGPAGTGEVGESSTRAPTFASSYVGRSEVLQRLDAGLEAALAGRGAVVLLSGAPGIGKTRTSEEVVARAEARGAEVLWGRCLEDEGAPPLWPWMQILESAARRREPRRLLAELGEGASEVAAVVAGVRERLPDLDAPPSLEPSGHQFLFFESVGRFLVRASEQRPIVVVLEDLHEAGITTLQLLRVVAGALRGTRVLLVATHREAALRSHPALHEAIADLRRLPHTLAAIQLQGLAAGEVAELMKLLGGGGPDDVEELTARTEGNPLFVRELVQLFASAPAGGRIPPTVQATVRELARVLSPATHDLLSAAAVAGRDAFREGDGGGRVPELP